MRSSSIGTAAAPVRSVSSWNERRLARVVLALCLVVLPLLRYGFLRTNTATFDEFTHLQSGYRYWQCGEFANNPEHPPLVKFLAAAPIRKWQIGGYPTACGTAVITSRGMDIQAAAALFGSPHGEEMLWKARSVLIVFPLVLLVAVFFATRSWFGDVAAAIAAVLVTVEPTLVAHGSLVTTDMAVTAMMFVSVWAAIEFVRKPSVLRMVGVGIAIGLALTAKHSALPLPFIVLGTMLVARMPGRRTANGDAGISYPKLLGAWALMSALAFAGLWASYGFRYAALPHETKASYDTGAMFAATHMENTTGAKVTAFAVRHQLLPEAYVAGMADIMSSGVRPTYFFGKWYAKGFWYYFPVALAIKMTIGVLALFLIALLAPAVWREHGRRMAPLLVPLVVFLGFALMSKANIGVRHVLPVMPYMIVLAAAAASLMVKGSRALAAVAVALIVVSVGSALYAAPSQVSYANELFGGSNHTYRYLGDSNVDWGQSSGRLAAYLEEQHLTSNCAVASGTLWRAPSKCLELPNFVADIYAPQVRAAVAERFEGTLVVQPLAASWSSAYVPLLRRKPDEIHGKGTILVYRGSFDIPEIAALSHLYRGFYYFERLQDPVHALEEFGLAEKHCPESDREFLAWMTGAAKGALAGAKGGK